jgi:hypothetical protein
VRPNLSRRTLEWYADRTRWLGEWCVAREIAAQSDLGWSDLQAFVLDCRPRGFAANTAYGYAQVVKTALLARTSARLHSPGHHRRLRDAEVL